MAEILEELSEYVFEEFVPDMVAVKDTLRAEIKEHTDEYLKNGGIITYVTSVIHSSTEAVILFTNAANEVFKHTNTKIKSWQKERSDAKKAGLTKYEGRPCNEGHTEKWVRDNECCECHRIKRRAKRKEKKSE